MRNDRSWHWQYLLFAFAIAWGTEFLLIAMYHFHLLGAPVFSGEMECKLWSEQDMEGEITMNCTIYGIECIGILILFTCFIMIPLCRNPVWWIHDYPEDIQEKYFETHEQVPTQMLSVPVLLKKSFALLLALAILTMLVLAAGAEDFRTGFLYSYGLWLLVDWYDCFFLDWVLFANVKCIRLPGTEHMDKAYHQKKYHVIRSLIGMALGLLPCGLAGVLVMAVR